jgi:flagellar biosynthesis protein FliP
MKRRRLHIRRLVILGLLLTLLLLSGCTVSSQNTNDGVSIDFGDPADAELASNVQILILLTSLAMIPLLLIVMTGFVRIVVVLSVVRGAIGVPQLPPNQVIISLAVVLTFFVMNPVWTELNETALEPYLAGDITQEEALELGSQPLRDFMFRQVRDTDLALFINLAELPRPNDHDDVPTSVLVPAFVISELRTSFQMAFVIYIPFLVIDMIVSSTLLSMGMMMLPPTVVSLPFKLLLFVLVDGWQLLAESLVRSFA